MKAVAVGGGVSGKTVFPSSSMVEQAAVNRLVAGSSPASGASVERLAWIPCHCELGGQASVWRSNGSHY